MSLLVSVWQCVGLGLLGGKLSHLLTVEASSRFCCYGASRLVVLKPSIRTEACPLFAEVGGP